MKTTKTYGLVAVAALVFGAAACGGDDEGGGGDADSPLAQALAADMLADEDAATTDPEEAECWASGIVGGIGEDRLTELGMTVDNVGDVEDYEFTEAEISTVVDSMFDCVDVQASLTEVFEEDFGPEAAACLAEGLDNDMLKQVMTSELDGSEPSDEFFQAFLDLAAECDIPLN